jgi:hypothetical protein
MTRYKVVKIHGHPIASKNGFILEHRKVWFDNFGAIPNGSVIHHKNGDKHDNRIENLECLTRSQHMKEHYEHGLGIRNGIAKFVKFKCVVCDSEFTRRESTVRVNDKNPIGKHKFRTCSRSCWATVMNSYKHGKTEKFLSKLKDET